MRDRYPHDHRPRDREEYRRPDQHPGDSVQSHDDDWHEDDQAGVWIKESQSRLGYSEADLIDVERYQSPDIRSKLFAVLASIAALMLVGLLAWSTLPTVTPSEIIASGDYGKSASEVSKPAILNTIPTATSEPATTQTTTTLKVIPANTTIATDERYNSGTGNSDNLSSGESGSVDYGSHRVRQRWSNVRATPGINGSIVVSLDINTPITVLSESGEWFEILTPAEN